MAIFFAPFDLNSGTFMLRRAPQLRMADKATTFLLRRQPRLAMTGTAVTHVPMLLNRPRRRLRMADRTNVFLLPRQPRLAMAGALPIPSASIFVLSRPAHRLAMTTTITTHATMALHRQPRLLMTGADARFLLHRTPRLYMSDGHVSMDRIAFLLQQPEIYATAVVGLKAALADHIVAHDSYQTAFIHALFDLMTVNDTYASLTHALQSLMDNMSLRDLAALIYSAGLFDSFIASGVLTSYAQITALLADGFEFDETADAKSQILAAIHDGLYIHVTLSTGQDTYTAWVMTPETKAMRSYGNWPFNSYAQMGGMTLAAGPLGVYRLGSATDAGAIIAARVRSGLLDFGTGRLKRINRAYIGYTSSGTLCLRMCAISETGDKVEYTYKMVAQTANSPIISRISAGRGPRSVYWSFELCNDATGSDFELHDISVLPMVLTGRITDE